MRKTLTTIALSIAMFTPALAANATPEVNPIPVATMLPDTIVISDTATADGTTLITGSMAVGLKRCPFQALYISNPKEPTGLDAVLENYADLEEQNG